MNIFKFIVLSMAVMGGVFAFEMTTDTEANNGEIIVKTDPESIGKGKNLFDSKCSFCHAYSTETIVGSGLRGCLEYNCIFEYPLIYINT